MPAGWKLAGELLPTPAPSLRDEAGAILAALRGPVQSPGIRDIDLSGKRIAVVVDDLTRPTPVSKVFPLLLEELLAAGARARDMSVIVALGTHRPMTPEEIGRRLGIWDPSRPPQGPGAGDNSKGALMLGELAVVNHDCRDRALLQRVGRTAGGTDVLVNRYLCEADFVVLVGTIEPHLLAGFGGGLKNAVPGCAGEDVIAEVHLGVKASSRYTMAGTPAADCVTRRRLEEAAQMVPAEYFMVNTVLNPDGTIAGVFAGDPVAAHRSGSDLAARIYGARQPVGPEPHTLTSRASADIFLVSSSPMDHDLRQGTKCLANVLPAAREGALLLGFLRCEEGVGDMFIPPALWPLGKMRQYAAVHGAEELVRMRAELSGLHMDMDAVYMNEFMAEVARRHHVLIYAPDLPPDTGERLGAFELFSDLGSMLARAVELKPTGVAVSSPLGGICYPAVHTANANLNEEGRHVPHS